MNNLELLARDIQKAQAWMKNRFPAERPSVLFPTGFKVSFPAPDKASVTPTAYGELMAGASATFQLCWRDGKLYWKGNFELRKALLGEGNVIEHCVGLAEGDPGKEG